MNAVGAFSDGVAYCTALSAYGPETVAKALINRGLHLNPEIPQFLGPMQEVKGFVPVSGADVHHDVPTGGLIELEINVAAQPLKKGGVQIVASTLEENLIAKGFLEQEACRGITTSIDA